MRKLLALAAALLWCSTALAATTPNSIVAPQTPNRGILQFLAGSDSAGTYKTLYTAGANGSICNGIVLTSNDPASHLVTLQLVSSAVKYGGTALNSGTTLPGFANAVPPINVMSQSNPAASVVGIWPGLPLDQNGNPYITLNSGDTLQATFATTLTTSDFVNLIAFCQDY
jgi:hypothetical protein